MRIATPDDLAAIVEIYNSTIADGQATADTSPVTVSQRQGWFSAHSPTRRPILVEEQQGKITGWLSFSDFNGRPAYAGTAEISLYIHSNHRRKGLGRKMLNHAINLAGPLEIQTLLGFIFSHNKNSLQLFEQSGFERWGQLPNVASIDKKALSVTIVGLPIDNHTP